MRLIDADALIEETMERYCKDCERRKGVKNGKWKIVYSIGDAPCRACGTGDMIDELEDAPTIEPERTGRWIPCSERLPEANERDEKGFCIAYLVQDARWMDVARWDGEYWIAWGYGTVLDNVTAWMPLPEPYKGGNRDD